ncbi:hypothetical protein PASE110613_10495 [Paenibacillus sediminis]|uniref:O-antigen ligase domain-containing protein n=1 Tax=Paenibacillus sediminis TaxID=664909 RepID=A0ABS4H561_9BACL|nr:hypothetical protein [Paenibacillus sediminis]MBP1937387.1 hypothetical protein [Paenibacillus sediminis]
MNQKATMNVIVPQIYMKSIGINTLSSLAFIFAMLIYAGFSAPFPANPGVAEVLIAFLLVIFVTIPTSVIVIGGGFTLYKQYFAMPVWLHLSFFLLLWWGVFNGGVVYAWGLNDVVRDVIPCIYLFVPLLLLPTINRSKMNWLYILPWLLSLMGVIMAVRFYYVVQISPFEIGKMYYFDNFLYLSYDPSVSFASVFLPIMAVHTWRSKSLIRWICSLLMLMGGVLALGSLMAVAQRAPLGLAAFSYFVYFLMISRKSIKKIMLLLALAIVIGAAAQHQIQSSYDLLMAKQENFGLNGKTDEMMTVIKETSGSVYSLLFGMGWGGLFHDPAVNNIKVSYTHSAVTFFLLKGGIFGLTIFVSYLFWLLRNLLKSMNIQNLPYILSCLVPLMIGLLFQVSYKTLSYGIILTLLCLLYQQRTSN